MWHTLVILSKLFCLRASPGDIPYSRVLLGILAILFLALDSITDVWFVDIVNNYDQETRVYLSLNYSLLMSLVWLLILYAIIRSTLTHYKLTDRLVQVMTAFLWADTMLAVIYLGGVAILSRVTLPIEDNSFTAMSLLLAFVVYLYWQFMLYLHIIFNSLNISVLKAGLFTLLYILLQYNISEILINFMVVEKIV